MKKLNLFEQSKFSDSGIGRFLVHDSPYFKILTFSFKAGQKLPIHSHDIEGQVSILVLEGEGKFLKEDGEIEAKPGDILICDISVPHGVEAISDMRVLVTIAPPI